MKAISTPVTLGHTLSLGVLTAGIALALLTGGCSSSASETAGGPPPAEVSIAPVLQKNVRQWDEFTGRLAAVDTVELRPRVSGYVDRVAFQEGQEVQKGELLFVIDKRPYQAQLAQAQAQLERARSDAKRETTPSSIETFTSTATKYEALASRIQRLKELGAR